MALVLAVKRGQILLIGETKISWREKNREEITLIIDAPKNIPVTRQAVLEKYGLTVDDALKPRDT